MSSTGRLSCPGCGADVIRYRNPFPTADIIIRLTDRDAPSPIVLIQRANEPLGWAIPGGFIDYAESAEAAAVREAKEETGLEVRLSALLGVYSRPGRDPRFHTLTMVYIAEAQGEPVFGDDAAGGGVFSLDQLPADLCFDHREILEHFHQWQQGQRPAAAVQTINQEA